MGETISLQEIFATVKKRLWMIALIMILATAISGVVNYFILTPVYQAETQILVNQSSSNQRQGYDQSQIQANIDLVNTYSVIIKSPTILNRVAKQLNLNQTADQLRKELTVSSEQNSQVFNVKVKNPDPARAANIVNVIADVFQTQIKDIMSVDNVSILSKANVGSHPSPVKPNLTLNMAIAFVVGLMVGLGLAFLLEYMDHTIKNEQDIETILKLPSLGVVSEINSKDRRNTRSRSLKHPMGGETFEAQ